MAEVNLGVNLSLEEKEFLGNYCNLLSQYGSINSFPMSDQEKIYQSRALGNITSKLTVEELARFNSFQSNAEYNVFMNEVEQDTSFGSR